MAALALAARLLLAAVFVVAAVGKLRDPAGSRRALTDFGVPRVATRFAILLPIVELAVAATLVPTGTARWGALGALALLAVFTVVIAVTLARGQAPECNCFGSIGSSPVRKATLARNVALFVPATYVVARPDAGPSALGWLSGRGSGELAALVVAAVAVTVAGASLAAVWHLLRSRGRLLLHVDEMQAALDAAGIERPAPAHVGLPLGERAPDFSLPTLDGGRPIGLAELTGRGRPVLLLASSAGCGPCRDLLPDIADWQSAHGDELTIAVLASGDADAARLELAAHGVQDVLLDAEAEVAASLRAFGTPTAVLVDAEQRVASGVAGGRDAIEQLLVRALHDDEPLEDGLPVGRPAPHFELPGLGGSTITSADLRGSERLLVFWNPGCGFCSAMLDDLLSWEASPQPGAPEALIISSGDAAQTRANGFSSAVALDPDLTVGAAFGAAGTPMAVLLDAGGSVASGLAAGAEAVMRLARGATGDFEVVQVLAGQANGRERVPS